MKLLYITPLWSGLKPFFYNASEENSGMPAFFKVFSNILNDPKVSLIYVTLFVYGSQEEINIPNKFKGKIKIQKVFITGRLSLYLRMIQVIFSSIILVKKEKINIIYSHGTISFLGGIVGIISGVKHYRRIYGTFLYKKVLAKRNVFFSNFFEYLNFKLPSDGIIMTNDGTSGDKVFRYINKENNSNFHFLINGVDKSRKVMDKFKSFPLKERYFTYIARIDSWKRQHLLIEILADLNKEGIDFPHTYIVGQIYDVKYNEEIENLILDNFLSSKITIVGPVSSKEVKYLLKNSYLSFSFYDYSNLGNVFLEGLALGTAMMAINEYNSLDKVPENSYISITTANKNEIKTKLKNLLNNPLFHSQIKQNALNFSQNNLSDWDTRILKEKQIILQQE
tara:strand:+ start:409 stop:1590 length:1182 start_codon:yes stop_codon:yes gene_type:complete